MSSTPIAEIAAVRLERHEIAEARTFALASRLAMVSLVAYCVISAVGVIWISAHLLHNPWENTHPEGPHVYVAMQAARTGHLYFSYFQSPYAMQQYGPFYYVINATVAWASHLNLDSMVLHARLLSYVSYLLTGFLVFAMSRELGSSYFFAFLSAAMTLGIPDLTDWSVTVRPDALCLMVVAASLYFALRAEESEWCWAMSGFLAGLAFLIKQPGIAVVGAIGLVLVLRKEYRKTAILAIGTVAPIAVMFGALVWHKEPFWAQFTSLGKGYWSARQGASALKDYFTGAMRAVPLGLGVLGAVRAVKLNAKWQMVVSFTAVTLLSAISGLPQVGSGSHYFLPVFTGCALLLPVTVEFFKEHMRLTWGLAIVSVVLMWTTATNISYDRWAYHFYAAPSRVSYAKLRPYRIISDLSLLSLQGHDPELLDSFAVHALELKGNWSSAPVVENIRDEKYDLILLMRVDFTHVISAYRGVSDYAPSVVTALNQNYVVLCSTLTSMVLEPRDRRIPLPPQYFGQLLNVRCGTGLTNKSPGLVVDPDAQ